MFLQYLGENGQISTCSTTDTGFISTKLFFVFKPNFDIFAEIHQKKMLKIHVAIWHRIPTSEFLCVITNHATDAIKAILRTVNMTFRKLKKNNIRNTNKHVEIWLPFPKNPTPALGPLQTLNVNPGQIYETCHRHFRLQSCAGVKPCSQHPTEVDRALCICYAQSAKLPSSRTRQSRNPVREMDLHCVPKKTCDHIFDDKLK